MMVLEVELLDCIVFPPLFLAATKWLGLIFSLFRIDSLLFLFKNPFKKPQNIKKNEPLNYCGFAVEFQQESFVNYFPDDPIYHFDNPKIIIYYFE